MRMNQRKRKRVILRENEGKWTNLTEKLRVWKLMAQLPKKMGFSTWYVLFSLAESQRKQVKMNGNQGKCMHISGSEWKYARAKEMAEHSPKSRCMKWIKIFEH